MIEETLAVVVLFVEMIGAALIIFSAVAGAFAIVKTALRVQGHDVLTEIRLDLAQRLVLALEFLIAADILKTITTPTLEGMALLGAIIGVRTVLTLSVAYELRRERPSSACKSASTACADPRSAS